MSGAKQFEDLIVWQQARTLTREIYLLTRQTPFACDLGLTNQIQQFHYFLSVAKASCAEVRSQLYIALDVGYLSHSQFKHLLSLAEEIGRILGGLLVSIRRSAECRVPSAECG